MSLGSLFSFGTSFVSNICLEDPSGSKRKRHGQDMRIIKHEEDLVIILAVLIIQEYTSLHTCSSSRQTTNLLIPLGISSLREYFFGYECSLHTLEVEVRRKWRRWWSSIGLRKIHPYHVNCEWWRQTVDQWLWDEHRPGNHSLKVQLKCVQYICGLGGLWSVEIRWTHAPRYPLCAGWTADEIIRRQWILLCPLKNLCHIIFCVKEEPIRSGGKEGLQNSSLSLRTAWIYQGETLVCRYFENVRVF